jgi:hypothetical protein
MPTFSYKGYDFEVDHTPTEQEFAQMSQYVDTLPAKGGLVPQVQGSPEVQGTPMSGALETITSMVSGLPQAVHQMGTRAALAASNITDPAQKEQILQEATPQLLKDITYEPKTETGKRYAETAGEVWNTIARSPFAALEAVVQGRGQTGARDIVSEKTPSRFTDVGALAVDVGECLPLQLREPNLLSPLTNVLRKLKVLESILLILQMKLDTLLPKV